jgi:predicted CoA-substrate-specific enzyme activase
MYFLCNIDSLSVLGAPPSRLAMAAGITKEEKPMTFAGMDIGSRTIKIALLDAAGASLIGCKLWDQGLDQQGLTRALYDQVLNESGISKSEVVRSVATGYGRNAIEFADAAVTEITCHAAGVRLLHPDVRTIIDIGGEDSKVIRLDARGKVQDFAMNDRCAAGTGRFLEVVARRLEGDLSAIARAAEGCSNPVSISSMCVVFAETEIVGLLASGTPIQEIMAGVQKSIASRIVGMVGRHAQDPFYFTGGVALVPGMAQAMAGALGREIKVSNHAQFTGALGAAIMASRQAE